MRCLGCRRGIVAATPAEALQFNVAATAHADSALARPRRRLESLMHTGPSRDSAIRLQLTVWGAQAGRWCARAELVGGQTHVFDSPFELVRFLAQLADRRAQPAEPVDGGGLR
jgi:hypothetical protein